MACPISLNTPPPVHGDDDPQALPHIPREKRSLWLGHSVDGSRTTDHYENFDRELLEDVAIGTDFILSELQKRCKTRLLAVELQLNRKDLARIGAKASNKPYINQEVDGGRYRDRTYDPTRVKGVLSR